MKLLILVWAHKHKKNTKEGENTTQETFKILCFNIHSKIDHNEYEFSFKLNCKLEELLKFPDGEMVDFNQYIFYGETIISIKGLYNIIDPRVNAKIIRYLNHKFTIFLTFYTDEYYHQNDSYSGMIEISFDLDDYLEK